MLELFVAEPTVDLVDLTAEIVTAHVSRNNVALVDLPKLIESVHVALTGLREQPAEEAPQDESKRREPAVGIRASVKPDYLICLVCGAKQKTLKRHLGVAHQMTPAQYRDEFGLKPDYPLTAPNYSERRRGMAHSIGLGRKPARAEAAAPAEAPVRPEAPAPAETPAPADAAPSGAAGALKKARKRLSIATSK